LVFDRDQPQLVPEFRLNGDRCPVPSNPDGMLDGGLALPVPITWQTFFDAPRPDGRGKADIEKPKAIFGPSGGGAVSPWRTERWRGSPRTSKSYTSM
jgi:hypothetical protein